MDRLILVEPTSEVAIRVEPGQRCSGGVTLRNVMYTMPVAFRLHAVHRARYVVKPQSGIIPPLATIRLDITYHPPPGGPALPEAFPASDDSFLLHSVVVPGAAARDVAAALDAVPHDWFTTKKKQVFVDSGVRVFFVGSAVLAKLVAEGTMEAVREVLERSDPAWRAADAVDAQGNALLHIAVERGRADLVQLLLEFEPDVEAANRSGKTPLEAAAAAGEGLIVEILLSRRAATGRSPGSGWAAVHHAAAGGHGEVLRLLLAKGADPDVQGEDGRTALHLAAEGRRRDCVRVLLAGGARPEVRGGGDGGTALHCAAAAGDEQGVRLILASGGAGTKEIRNRAGRTAYEVAAEGGHARLYDALRLGDGLCAAARKGEPRAAGRMVERGAAVNGRDQHGWTALMRAGFKGRVEVMRALIDMGAEVDARDEEGYTALHCAVEAGHAEAVEILVKRGANLEARAAKGATAMQIAGSLGYAGIARILAQGGASRDGAPPVMPPITAPSPPAAQKLIRKKPGEGIPKEKDGKRRVGRVSVRAVRGVFGTAAPPLTCTH